MVSYEAYNVTIYKYLCSDCGKKRETRFEERADERLCRPCKRKRPPEGQMLMFENGVKP